MAIGIPPPPINSPNGSYYWIDWYSNLTNFLNHQNLPWSSINFTTSDIHDIVHRKHNELTNIQGGTTIGDAGGSGNAYHLVGYGYSNGDSTSYKLPSGWSVSGTGGIYTVTHNLGLSAPNYMAGATSNTSGAIVVYVDTSDSNSIVIRIAPTTNLAVVIQASFSFWIGTL